MADTERRLKVTLDGDASGFQKQFKGAKGSTDALGRSLDGIQGQIKKTLEDSAGQLGRFGSVLSSIGPGGVAAAAGITALGVAAAKTAAEIKALAERGNQVIGVERSFQALAAAPTDLLAKTQEASKGMVSEFDIMQAANKGLLLGLPITADEMAKLSRTAIILGEAMNVGPGQALSDLITGLGRGSAAILDNLGINVKAEAAYATYAASIGKASSALTEQEKKLAIYRAALSAADEATSKIGGSQDTAGKSITRLSTAWQNLTDEIARVVAQDPALIQGLNEVAAAVSFIGAAIRENKDEIGLLLDVLFPSRVGTRIKEQVRSVVGEAIGRREGEGLPEPKQRSPLGGGPTGSIGDIFGSVSGEPLPAAEAQLKALTEGVRQDFEKLKSDRIRAAEEYRKTLEKLAEEERRGAIEANERWEAEEKAVQALNDAARQRISDAQVSIFGTSKQAATEAAFQFGILQTAIERAGSSIDQMSAGELANFEETLVKLEKASRDDAEANDLIATTLGRVRARQRELKDEFEQATPKVARLSKETERWLSILRGLGKVVDVVGSISAAFDQMGIRADAGIGKVVKGLEDLARAGEAGAESFAKFSSGDIAGGISSGIQAIGSVVSGIKKLFGSDPVKKAQERAGKALGHGISREMAEQFLKEAKETGKSIEQVAKDWQRRIRAEQDAANLETLRAGVGIAQQGAEGLLGLMGKLSPAAQAAGGALVKAVADAMAANGLGVLDSQLQKNEQFSAVQEAVGAAGQVFDGLRQAGGISTDLLANGGAFADALRQQAVEAALAEGKSQEEANKAGLAVIAPLLRDQLEASIQSGEQLSAQTQALLDEAKANGIEIVADPMIALLGESQEQTALLRKIAGGAGAAADAGEFQGKFRAAAGLGPLFTKGGSPRLDLQLDPHEAAFVVPRVDSMDEVTARLLGGIADPGVGRSGPVGGVTVNAPVTINGSGLSEDRLRVIAVQAVAEGVRLGAPELTTQLNRRYSRP